VLYALNNNDPAFPLEAALNDLRQIIVYRMQTHFNQQPINFDKWLSDAFNNRLIRQAVIKHVPTAVSAREYITLLLSLVPHVQPNFFESIIAAHLPNGGDFAEFGGVKGSNHRSILPTGETVQFILAGTDLEQRLQVHQLFSEDHFFYQQGILWLEPVKEGEPIMSGRIVMAQDWIDKLLLDKESAPRFGLDFPAKRIATPMIWDDVVLNQQTKKYVSEISNWLQLHHLFDEDENLKRKIKPGYRVLFYGPSGTGKTLTAALLGKQFNKEVYRVDLSQVVSKYIGETEKNLEGIFKKAETKNWILFFDEADALFGKRTTMQSAHDKYANQEVSYLLQRVEDYPGLLILATNFKSNLDEAFLRRFHSLIHFPMPNSSERLLLWQRSMPASLQRDADIKLEELAKQFEISGASILNAVQYATLQTYARNNGIITQQDLIDGVRKEYQKEDKSF
jgi:AAA+ superfamily predicted ATPase